jgi:crossover junction endodeoxyribonuclease RuvC
MIILGIDPGIATVGWGALKYEGSKFAPLGFGIIKTEAGKTLQSRLVSVAAGIERLIAKYKPDDAAIEELFFNTNQKTGIAVAQARGVIMLSCARCGLHIAEYTPLQVKQAVVGYGRAEKSQVIAMVTAILGLPKPPHPDDAADALALAICHAHSSN